MTSQTTVKTLLILGASGDLTGRLLLPGLARLVSRGRADGLTLVGAGSDAWTPEQWMARLEESFADANSQASGRTTFVFSRGAAICNSLGRKPQEPGKRPD